MWAVHLFDGPGTRVIRRLLLSSCEFRVEMGALKIVRFHGRLLNLFTREPWKRMSFESTQRYGRVCVRHQSTPTSFALFTYQFFWHETPRRLETWAVTQRDSPKELIGTPVRKLKTGAWNLVSYKSGVVTCLNIFTVRSSRCSDIRTSGAWRRTGFKVRICGTAMV